ncbi:MAG: hypothetical protein ABEJ92_09250 [Halobacteriales archaeon]
MALDIDPPAPPRLANRGVPAALESAEAVGGTGDLRREELDAVLRDGAWQEAFEEWAAYTDLTDEEVALLEELGVFQRLDVFWDPQERRLRAEAPTLPEDWPERTDVAPSDASSLGSTFAAELADFTQAVVEMLEETYLDWGDTEGSDPVWSEETFGHGVRE